ncbi:MAG TPA: UDP-N-acetylglucosamine--N-acetylmuramyl-(pentapeptide) pyrophosphoryl-undecaprenol N-acetylglucosamine transferase, partial [Limnobacter sp.]|nr:UDP-N-acetylglucosamine--N-acetylmuramyl-(pentapeptide) pyrophosphoryl-undecaprenol N-acetylglucosamine transferase [Limnobacter sp.]
MSNSKALALIVAGGTGGHIFPGLSVAEELKQRGWQVEWVGNPQAMEGRLVPQHGIQLNTLVFSGFRGKGIVQQLLIPLKLLRAFWTSLQILRRTKPAVVLGMGGYVAFPLGMMASLLNIPLVVHEQNSIAGLTNKLLSKLANRNLVAFPGALPLSTWVGNPVRSAIADQPVPEARFRNRSGPLKLLVLGGSLGAQALNEVVPQALARLPLADRPIVVHQAGEKNLPSLADNYLKAGVQAEQLAFIQDVATAMA